MAEVLLLELGIAILGLALAGAIAHRIGLSVIPAYILAGLFIGPNAPESIAGVPLTLVSDSLVIELMAELGVVFLLFFLGLEFSVGQLVSQRDSILRVGTLDFVVNFGSGLVIGYLLDWGLIETLFLAGIVYISSSAVITKGLIEQGWVANDESNPILGTLVFEDIVIALYLALLAALAVGGSMDDVTSAMLITFVFLGAVSLVAWRGTTLIERAVGIDSDEQFLLRVIGITVFVAGLALHLGVSEAVAAFFVGTAFSTTSYMEKLERIITPARDLFGAMFFFAIGIQTDITVLSGVLWLLAAAIVVTTVTKLVSGWISGRIYGLSPRRSVRVAVGMVPRGEFSLIIAALAASATTGSYVLQTVVPAFTVGYVLIMSIVGTLLMQNADLVTDTLFKE